VAASATSAPPVIRPLPSALVASTLRRRIDMGGVLLSVSAHRPAPGLGRCALCASGLWLGP
jgi:hypothetical protein